MFTATLKTSPQELVDNAEIIHYSDFLERMKSDRDHIFLIENYGVEAKMVRISKLPSYRKLPFIVVVDKAVMSQLEFSRFLLGIGGFVIKEVPKIQWTMTEMLDAVYKKCMVIETSRSIISSTTKKVDENPPLQNFELSISDGKYVLQEFKTFQELYNHLTVQFYDRYRIEPLQVIYPHPVEF